MELTQITKEQQAEILKNRLLQYEGDYFNCQINKQIAEAGSAPEEIVLQFNTQMEQLDAAHALVKSELDNLPT